MPSPEVPIRPACPEEAAAGSPIDDRFLLGTVLYLFVALIGGPLAQLAVTHAVSEIYLGRQLGIGQAYSKGLAAYFPYMGTVLLAGMGMMLGLLCLFLPGIYLAVLFFNLAVLAVDLVRAYGTPWTDERFHGLRETRTLTEVLGGARLGLLLMLCALFVLAIGARRRWPPRVLSEPEGPEPSLLAFVDSLTRHYIGTRDHPEIFEAYKEGFKHRLRGHRLGDGQLSEREFAEKLERAPALGAESRLWLLGSGRPASSRELLRAGRALERFAEGTASTRVHRASPRHCWFAVWRRPWGFASGASSSRRT